MLPVDAIETFDGKASFERVPEIIIPNTPTEFEIKFHYVGKPYVLYDLIPVIDVNPESAIPFVQIETVTSELQPSVPGRIPVTITVDKNIPHQKIFLSVSYDAVGYGDKPYKSSWSDFLTLEIGKNQVAHHLPPPSISYMSPHDQVFVGIDPKNVECKYELKLIQKYDGSPACVKPETKQKLIERGWIVESKTKLWKSTDDWNSLKLVRNDSLYCSSVNEESSDHCYSLETIVFGDGTKKKETGWKLYPGGAGWTLPENSTLVPIHKKVDFGVPPLDFTAMLDDEIFVNRCESNDGIWNYAYHDCENLGLECKDMGGIHTTIDELHNYKANLIFYSI